jgi:ribosomal-protein-alanine N-acetyltransferase
LHFFTIETPRLLLREITPNDVSGIFSLYSDYNVLRYTDNELHTNLTDSELFINDIQHNFNTEHAICWGITLKPNTEIIGTIRLYHIDRKHCFVSIGNLLAPGYWNRGIMTEAQYHIVEFAFNHLNMHRLEAQVFVGNTASIRTFNKLNFTNEGILRENFLIEGIFENSYLFSILKNEFVRQTAERFYFSKK